MNLQQYKSIFSLFLLCTTLILPILIFIEPISSWLASFDNIDTAEPTLKTGGTMYTILSLLNLPLFFVVLFRQANTRLINQIYTVLFLLLSILLLVVNPMDVLTSPYSLQSVIAVTAVVFFLLKYSFGFLKQLVLVLLVIVLGICGETVWSNHSTYTLYYFLFYLVGYLWNVIVMDRNTVHRVELNVYDTAKAVYARSPGFSRVFFLEILLIIVLLYGRTWMKQYYGGDLVVHKPILLNSLSSYTISNPYQYTYTLSFWLYIDATSPGFSTSSNEFTDVVLYGDNVLIAYNSSLNTLRTVMKNRSKKTIHDMRNVPLQKWNHVVLSYANGTLDLFLNGQLQKSTLAIPQMSTQEVQVGAEQGVQGKLCTLMFYNKVLTIQEIRALYTQFKDKNPPTI
jgi:hypothetical protein